MPRRRRARCAASRNAATSGSATVARGPSPNACAIGSRSARASRFATTPTRRHASSDARARDHRPDAASMPANPGAGRGPRSARSSARTPSSQASRPSPPSNQRMLEQRQQRQRREIAAPPPRRSPVSSVPGGRIDNGCPAESSISIPQRAQMRRNPTRQRRGRASPARRSAPAPPTPRAARSRSPAPLSAGVASSAAATPVSRRCSAFRSVHFSVKSCGRQARWRSHAAHPRRIDDRCRRATPATRCAVHAHPLKQQLQMKLRMHFDRARTPRRSPDRRSCGPSASH